MYNGSYGTMSKYSKLYFTNHSTSTVKFKAYNYYKHSNRCISAAGALEFANLSIRLFVSSYIVYLESGFFIQLF